MSGSTGMSLSCLAEIKKKVVRHRYMLYGRAIVLCGVNTSLRRHNVHTHTHIHIDKASRSWQRWTSLLKSEALGLEGWQGMIRIAESITPSTPRDWGPAD